ncbi:PEP-CTERM sorting domain-containing protein [Paludisphaera sp.]|uniref:PEP-CTERM sorting domain-containing protein n=1 Tax=Paludisphaera sp. TaxID=2017432 RepID=UPI00301BAACF
MVSWGGGTPFIIPLAGGAGELSYSFADGVEEGPATFQAAPVPEPSTLTLALLGAAMGLGSRTWRGAVGRGKAPAPRSSVRASDG